MKSPLRLLVGSHELTRLLAFTNRLFLPLSGEDGRADQGGGKGETVSDGQAGERRGRPFWTAGAPGVGNRQALECGTQRVVRGLGTHRRAGGEWCHSSGVCLSVGAPGSQVEGGLEEGPPRPHRRLQRLPLGAGPLWGRCPSAFLAEILEDKFNRVPCYHMPCDFSTVNTP